MKNREQLIQELEACERQYDALIAEENTNLHDLNRISGQIEILNWILNDDRE
jgi:hypothetical protein